MHKKRIEKERISRMRDKRLKGGRESLVKLPGLEKKGDARIFHGHLEASKTFTIM